MEQSVTFFVAVLGDLDLNPEFLQRVSIACYAKRCISYRKSVRLTDRLTV